MDKKRLIFFSALIISGVILLSGLYFARIKTQYTSTLSPFFQIFGRTTKSLDRILSRVIPVDSLDEGEFGEALKASYDNRYDKNDPDRIYLNDIMAQFTHHSKKPFTYEVYIMDYGIPNAFAMPGGVIIVTRGLLAVLETEGELASILAHEMGHIEKSHCFELIRFELLARKTDTEVLGRILDFAVDFLLGHSFSKTMEDEADEYAYRLILKSKYDPASVGSAFARLVEFDKQVGYEEDEVTNIISDYLSTHPLLKLRMEKFTSLASAWRRLHKNEKRYLGKQNLRKRIALPKKDFGPSEWQ